MIEVFLSQFKSPLIYVLVAAALVSVLIGEFSDSILIAAVLLLNAAIVMDIVAFGLFKFLLDQGFSLEQARNHTLLLMVLVENVHCVQLPIGDPVSDSL